MKSALWILAVSTAITAAVLHSINTGLITLTWWGHINQWGL